MSTEHDVSVIRIGEVIKHEGADTLAITEVDGRPVIMRLGEYATGDLAVYVPIDSLVPVTDPRFAFLKPNAVGMSRIKAMRLRGVFSMGLLVKPDADMTEGEEPDLGANGDDASDEGEGERRAGQAEGDGERRSDAGAEDGAGGGAEAETGQRGERQQLGEAQDALGGRRGDVGAFTGQQGAEFFPAVPEDVGREEGHKIAEGIVILGAPDGPLVPGRESGHADEQQAETARRAIELRLGFRGHQNRGTAASSVFV